MVRHLGEGRDRCSPLALGSLDDQFLAEDP